MKSKINETKLNIFFCLENKPEYLEDIEKIIETKAEQILLIKPYFNTSSIIREILYYIGIEVDNRGEKDKTEIQNLIISFLPLDKVEKLLTSFILEFKKEQIMMEDHPFFIFLPYENIYNKIDLINKINSSKRYR